MKKRLLAVMVSLVLMAATVPSFAMAEQYVDDCRVVYEFREGEAVVVQCRMPIFFGDILATVNGYPVTTIGANAFSGVRLPPEWTVPDHITTIEDGAFEGCYDLTTLTIGKNLVNLGRCFLNIGSLTQIIVDEENPVCASVDGVLFSKDKTELLIYPAGKLTERLVLPEGITSIREDAICSWENPVKEVILPKSMTKIDGLNKLYKVEKLHIPASITEINPAVFNGWGDLTEFTVDEANPAFTAVDGVLFTKDMKKLVRYPNNKFIIYSIACGDFGCNISPDPNYYVPEGVEVLGEYSFYGCSSSLYGLVIAETVTTIEPLAFGRYSFRSLTLPAATVNLSYESFYDAFSLSSITVHADNPAYASVDGILYTKDMTTVVLCPAEKFFEEYTAPATVTTIGDYAFYRNRQLLSVTLPSNVTTIGAHSFEDCTELIKVQMPGVVQVGDAAFKYAFELTDITFSAQLTYLSKEMFRECSALKTLDLPASLTVVGEKAFYGCYMLNRMNLPQGVTEIGNEAFAYCEELEQIRLPESLETVGAEAFYNCDVLSEVLLPGKVTQIGEMAFGWYTGGYSNGLRLERQKPFTIYGMNDSESERYATANGYSYQSLDNCVIGDVDGNTMIDAKDALIVLQMAVGKTDQTAIRNYIGDMTKDGMINAIDALRILQMAVQ